MAKAPFMLIELLLNLIQAVFSAEKTKLPGEEKETEVLKNVTPIILKAGSPGDIIKYLLVALRIIKAIVKIMNDIFGKNGWQETE